MVELAVHEKDGGGELGAVSGWGGIVAAKEKGGGGGKKMGEDLLEEARGEREEVGGRLVGL